MYTWGGSAPGPTNCIALRSIGSSLEEKDYILVPSSVEGLEDQIIVSIHVRLNVTLFVKISRVGISPVLLLELTKIVFKYYITSSFTDIKGDSSAEKEIWSSLIFQTQKRGCVHAIQRSNTPVAAINRILFLIIQHDIHYQIIQIL